MLLCIIENINPNYNIIPGFAEKIPKQHLKFVLYQNKVFSTASTSSYSYFSLNKTPCFIFFSSCLFCKTLPLLNHPKSHHYDLKQQEFKIQTNKVLWLIPILTTLFILNHIPSLPPWHYPLRTLDFIFEILVKW
jgi:hypothetical protein